MFFCRIPIRWLDEPHRCGGIIFGQQLHLNVRRGIGYLYRIVIMKLNLNRNTTGQENALITPPILFFLRQVLETCLGEMFIEGKGGSELKSFH